MTGVLQVLIGSAEPSAAYSPEATALFAAMTVQPDATRKGVIDTFIETMIADGVWAKIDALWVPRAHDAQAGRLNWKSPSNFALTAVNSPTFTTDRGYEGNASSMYLNTGWNPATNGVNYTQNSMSAGGYLTPSVGPDTTATRYILGCVNTHRLELAPRIASDRFYGAANSAADNAAGSTTRYGLTAINRAASTTMVFYRNGSSAASVSENSTGVPAAGQSMFLLANNNAGTPANYIDNQIGFAFVGGSLTAGEHAALDAALDTYITATP
jgi:hypothetical protein